MLALHFTAKGTGSWQCADGKLVRGDDSIVPLDHPMLTVDAFSSGVDHIALAILEHPAAALDERSLYLQHGDEDLVAQARAETENWPLHWLWLEASGGTIELRSSRWATVPLFLTGDATGARAHWDPVALYRWIRPRLDVELAAHYLRTFDLPYGPQTLFADLWRLAARHDARWTSGTGWRVRPYGAHPPDYPRVLRADVDPAAGFGALLRQTIDRALPPGPAPIACGLSGGMDSAAVTTMVAALGYEVRSFGIILPGAAGEAQAARRQAIAIDRVAADTPLAAAEMPNWTARLADPSVPFAPWEELQYEPFDRLYREAVAQGCRTFLTGLGGDELFARYRDEAEDGLDAPENAAVEDPAAARLRAELFTDLVLVDGAARSEAAARQLQHFAQPSAMDAVAGVAAQMLRHGLWPVHPLVSPELAGYAHALPLEWRADRRVLAELLAVQGVDERIARDPSPESFTPLFDRAFADCGVLEDLIEARALTAAGFVRPGAARRLLEARRAGAEDAGDLYLIAIAALEASLRAITAATTR